MRIDFLRFGNTSKSGRLRVWAIARIMWQPFPIIFEQLFLYIKLQRCRLSSYHEWSIMKIE